MARKLIQDVRNGEISLVEVPPPMASPGHVLIENRASVISAGTEKATMALSKKSLLGKARERPEEVRRVIQKVKQQGIVETVRQVREKLDEPISMGYCSSGIVVACGRDVHEFEPGDRVASNGPHADYVSVPKNLCAKLGATTSFEEGSFAVLGAIALHGIRLSGVTIGETVFVIGLGLVGQLTVSILNAMGCRVIATDVKSGRCKLAEEMGASLAKPDIRPSTVLQMTGGGADSVLITASTKSNEPITLAVDSVRRKGRIVLVGVVGLELDRRPFYFKEAEFVVSCSYGPGRYDPLYEERGIDYPQAYVRWTEQRNIQAVLDLMESERLDVSRLITHRFDFGSVKGAYQMIDDPSSDFLGVVLGYAERSEPISRVVKLHHGDTESKKRYSPGPSTPTVGVLGAGNYARLVFLPALKKVSHVRLKTLCSQGGLSAVRTGDRQGFEAASTDVDDVITDSEIDVVCILTRHNQHAEQVLAAIRADKHVYVEKPLCLTIQELAEIDCQVTDCSKNIVVGFNRRLAPATELVQQFFDGVRSPLSISIRFNAGEIPAEHWVHDNEIGGGRIIGEACHGIDLAAALCGSPPVKVYAESVVDSSAKAITDDQCFITLKHANGNISSVAYISSGDKGFPKERVEVFGGGRIAVIDDFRRITFSQDGRTRVKRLREQNKGHGNLIAAFFRSVSEGCTPPIEWHDVRAVSLASILAVRSLREGVPFELPIGSLPLQASLSAD